MGRSDEHIQNRFDGGIGSGKSRVADMLAEWGASVVDTDEIARALTAAGGSAMPAIEQAFGAEALAEDGSLDRAWMRERAFADVAVRQRLEAVLHPLIGDETERQADAARGCYLVFVVPLLVESLPRWRPRVDRICVVDCDPATQIARAVAQRADGACHTAYHGGTGCAGKPAGGRGRCRRQRWRHDARTTARADEDLA